LFCIHFLQQQQVSEGEEAAAAGAGMEKVKNLGNLLFSTIKGAGQKIKDTVSSN
jgi:hypothetical protein